MADKYQWDDLDPDGLGSPVAVAEEINRRGRDIELRMTEALGGVAPVGALFMYGAAAAPTGWLLCNGAAISRATYASLFAIIGVSYGVGDGATTFNVPNFASKFPRGNTVAAAGGSDDAVVVSHDHTFTGVALGTHGHADTFGFAGAAMANHSHSIDHNHGSFNSGNNHRTHTHITNIGSHRHNVVHANYDCQGLPGNLRSYLNATGASKWTDYTNIGNKTSGNNNRTHYHSINPPNFTGTSGSASAGTPAGSITGSVTAASAGTPAGTISVEGEAGAGKNIPAYLGVNFIIKH